MGGQAGQRDTYQAEGRSELLMEFSARLGSTGNTTHVLTQNSPKH